MLIWPVLSRRSDLRAFLCWSLIQIPCLCLKCRQDSSVIRSVSHKATWRLLTCLCLPSSKSSNTRELLTSLLIVHTGCSLNSTWCLCSGPAALPAASRCVSFFFFFYTFNSAYQWFCLKLPADKPLAIQLTLVMFCKFWHKLFSSGMFSVH